jgi:flagellar basal body-associated protein FliL
MHEISRSTYGKEIVYEHVPSREFAEQENGSPIHTSKERHVILIYLYITIVALILVVFALVAVLFRKPSDIECSKQLSPYCEYNNSYVKQ